MPITAADLRTSSLFSLEGKTAVLTGASGFLGRTFALALLANGARVVALGRSDRLQSEAKTWANEFGADKIAVHQIDMYATEALNGLCDRIAADEKSIDILINNAHELGANTGFNIPEGSLENASMDQWMKNLQGGVYWAVQTTQRLGIKMKEQKRGSIINIATMYATVAPRPQLYEGTTSLNPPGYSASKAALAAFTRYTASFWGREGVRANCISPGPFSNTEDTTENAVAEDSPFVQKLKGYTVLNRIGRPIELCGALLYLASDASTYVTGQNLIVDGGWTAV
ncbi:NAD(P)-dependent dehydrogenase, short-chain alcohol dehydrogenase family [Granulicella pectinivorans]|uniref:NAD(P)-dependent dehydrogenase, short-chain alcohol dehydrogenase family n=1 Tax=Granulicella pectinivorans TaxID=474950 RepID=A0A1I6M3C0_9BACT|nr:SDR family oxidoreductase [Granulicella pectinivorans]SFS10153.1 NAD(P)-dependent dehydrogenase, short-chain alcohol dehydrogenase family [Granulicella pectinivorans]